MLGNFNGRKREREMENSHTGGNEQQAACIQAPLTYMSGLEAEPQSLRPICITINIGSRCSDVNQASMMNLNKVVQQNEGRKHNAKTEMEFKPRKRERGFCCDHTLNSPFPKPAPPNSPNPTPLPRP